MATRIAQLVQWLGYVLDCLVFISQHVQEMYVFSETSRLAMRPTQPSIQWLIGVLSMVVKQLWCEPDHSSLSSAKVKT
jgi:hypothetical protein